MKVHWASMSVITLTVVSAGVILTAKTSTSGIGFAEATVTEELTPEALAKKSGCLECHSTEKKVIGPPFRDIATRYKGDPLARTALIEKIKKGGKGNWTEVTRGVPMPPHSRILSTAEIERLVDWVLSLEKE